MKVKKRGTAVEIDLHGLRAADAEARLLHLLDHTGPGGNGNPGHPRLQPWPSVTGNGVELPPSSPDQSEVKTLNEGQTRLLIRKK